MVNIRLRAIDIVLILQRYVAKPEWVFAQLSIAFAELDNFFIASAKEAIFS